MAWSKGFLFVDAGPPSTNIRHQEVQRSQILSHAATVSHPRNRDGVPVVAKEFEPPIKIFASDWSPGQEDSVTLRTGNAFLDEDHQPLQKCHSGQKKSYDVHRWRMIQKQSRLPLLDRNRSGNSVEPRSRTNPKMYNVMTFPIHKATPIPSIVLPYLLRRWISP